MHYRIYMLTHRKTAPPLLPTFQATQEKREKCKYQFGNNHANSGTLVHVYSQGYKEGYMW